MENKISTSNSNQKSSQLQNSGDHTNPHQNSQENQNKKKEESLKQEESTPTSQNKMQQEEEEQTPSSKQSQHKDNSLAKNKFLNPPKKNTNSNTKNIKNLGGFKQLRVNSLNTNKINTIKNKVPSSSSSKPKKENFSFPPQDNEEEQNQQKKTKKKNQESNQITENQSNSSSNDQDPDQNKINNENQNIQQQQKENPESDQKTSEQKSEQQSEYNPELQQFTFSEAQNMVISQDIKKDQNLSEIIKEQEENNNNNKKHLFSIQEKQKSDNDIQFNNNFFTQFDENRDYDVDDLDNMMGNYFKMYHTIYQVQNFLQKKQELQGDLKLKQLSHSLSAHELKIANNKAPNLQDYTLNLYKNLQDKEKETNDLQKIIGQRDQELAKYQQFLQKNNNTNFNMPLTPLTRQRMLKEQQMNSEQGSELFKREDFLINNSHMSQQSRFPLENQSQRTSISRDVPTPQGMQNRSPQKKDFWGNRDSQLNGRNSARMSSLDNSALWIAEIDQFAEDQLYGEDFQKRKIPPPPKKETTYDKPTVNTLSCIQYNQEKFLEKMKRTTKHSIDGLNRQQNQRIFDLNSPEKRKERIHKRTTVMHEKRSRSISHTASLQKTKMTIKTNLPPILDVQEPNNSQLSNLNNTIKSQINQIQEINNNINNHNKNNNISINISQQYRSARAMTNNNSANQTIENIIFNKDIDSFGDYIQNSKETQSRIQMSHMMDQPVNYQSVSKSIDVSQLNKQHA